MTPTTVERSMPVQRMMVAVGVASLLAGGCASDSGTSAPATTVTSTTTRPTTTRPTTTRPTTTSTVAPEDLGGRITLDVEGGERVYQLFVPPGHDIEEPAPLVIVAHGGQSNISVVIGRSGFDTLAAAEGIVVVYPEGDRGIWDFDDGAEMDRAEVNDVEFVSALIDDVASVMAIDEERVYAIGFSQGFGLAALLACHVPDRIAAVVSVAGLIHHDGPACPEPRRARVLAIAGERDPHTAEGSPGLPFADPPGPLTEEVEAWVATNGCDPTPEETALSEEVTRTRYSCAGDAALVVYLHPGGHDWPDEMSPGIETNRVIWEFLSQFAGPMQ